jgi:galactokinase
MAFDDLPLIDVPVRHEERVERLVAAFREQFVRPPAGIAEAPGRVNLIGEHVDYNDGLVLPFAIDRTVMCAAGRADGEGIQAYSVDYRELHIFLQPSSEDLFPLSDEEWAELDGLPAPVVPASMRSAGDRTWRTYVEGVVWALVASGEWVPSRHIMAIQGDVPQGAGLSSSAALETATMLTFEEVHLLDSPTDPVSLALLCQRAENEYVGVQCGIMDQFASALSKRDHALLIDCRTLDYRHIPLRLAEHGLAVVIANSAVPRQLASSAYNDRRRECEQAVARLRDVLGRADLTALRDVTAAEIDGLTITPDDVPLRRARHVVSEIGRVAAAVDALERDDFVRLGELMVESHLSLKNDYDVSSEQLDLLVGLATAQDYVLGARLTGAGFGGCTVNLVRADRIEDFACDVIAPYRERTGLPAVMYVTEACDGLRTWRL